MKAKAKVQVELEIANRAAVQTNRSSENLQLSSPVIIDTSDNIAYDVPVPVHSHIKN